MSRLPEPTVPPVTTEEVTRRRGFTRSYTITAPITYEPNLNFSGMRWPDPRILNVNVRAENRRATYIPRINSTYDNMSNEELSNTVSQQVTTEVNDLIRQRTDEAVRTISSGADLQQWANRVVTISTPTTAHDAAQTTYLTTTGNERYRFYSTNASTSATLDVDPNMVFRQDNENVGGTLKADMLPLTTGGLKKFLKENLELRVETNDDNSGNISVKATILLAGEEICYDSDFVNVYQPSQDDF